MGTLIVYSTKYGCTEDCAKKLSEKLNDGAVLCNLKKDKAPELSKYDKVVIGGSMYVGSIQKEVSEFCKNNLESLKNKKLGLYICAMQKDDVIESELKSAFPEELGARAASKECFGGEFIFSKMNFLDKLIVKKVSKIDKDTSTISVDKIDKFAAAMNNV